MNWKLMIRHFCGHSQFVNAGIYVDLPIYVDLRPIKKVEKFTLFKN